MVEFGSEVGKSGNPLNEQSTTVVSMSGRSKELLMQEQPGGQLLAASATKARRQAKTSKASAPGARRPNIGISINELDGGRSV